MRLASTVCKGTYGLLVKVSAMGNSESVQVGSPAPNSPQLSFSGGRAAKKSVIEDDYVDVGQVVDNFSPEQMEDQFVKIVVSEYAVGGNSNFEVPAKMETSVSLSILCSGC